MSNATPPRLTHQAGLRTTLRVGGVVLLVVALVFLISAAADFFSSMSSDSLDAAPHKFWMFFVAVPLLGVAGWCLQAGFLGAAGRFVAGETAPVLKETAGFLTDGRGILGVGAEEPSVKTADRFCASCGAAHAAGAKFCSSCGASLA